MPKFSAITTAIEEMESYAEYDDLMKIRVPIAFAVRHGATGD
jgi:hypothetical protein